MKWMVESRNLTLGQAVILLRQKHNTTTFQQHLEYRTLHWYCSNQETAETLFPEFYTDIAIACLDNC